MRSVLLLLLVMGTVLAKRTCSTEGTARYDAETDVCVCKKNWTTSPASPKDKVYCDRYVGESGDRSVAPCNPEYTVCDSDEQIGDGSYERESSPRIGVRFSSWMVLLCVFIILLIMCCSCMYYINPKAFAGCLGCCLCCSLLCNPLDDEDKDEST